MYNISIYIYIYFYRRASRRRLPWPRSRPSWAAPAAAWTAPKRRWRSWRALPAESKTSRAVSLGVLTQSGVDRDLVFKKNSVSICATVFIQVA